MKRFLGAGDDRSPEEKRKKREREQQRQMLAELLFDPVYKAKYDLAWSTLRKAENAVASAFDRLDQNILAAQTILRDMEQRAARLPGGDLVFRDQNDVVRYGNGDAVEDNIAETIVWSGAEPSFEEYRAGSDRLAVLETDRRTVERYETNVLGDARDRLSDETNPTSLEGLDDITDGINDQMPELMKQGFAAAKDATPSLMRDTAVALPILGGKP